MPSSTDEREHQANRSPAQRYRRLPFGGIVECLGVTAKRKREKVEAWLPHALPES